VLRSKAVLRGVVLAVALTAVVVSFTGCGGGGGGAVASVTGTVLDDSTLVPLASAQVRVGDQTVTTGADGSFSFPSVAVAYQTITVSRTGYDLLTLNTDLFKGANDLGALYLSQVQIPGYGHISGMVTDGTSPASGAMVVAGGKTAYSKPSGEYSIRNVAPGNQSVSATLGSKTGLGVVTVTAGSTASLNLSLSVGPPPPPVL
jgi:hypothetical protein